MVLFKKICVKKIKFKNKRINKYFLNYGNK